MNAKYRFFLTINGSSTEVFPIYGNNVSKDWDRETDQYFFREKINGKFAFVGSEFDLIDGQSFDTRFLFLVQKSVGDGFFNYFSGEFYKTDCSFDLDNKRVEVTVRSLDQYTTLLSGIENEYNLIDLKPEKAPIIANKRPVIQVYRLGDNVLTNFLSSMYWEDSCNLTPKRYELEDKYKFNQTDLFITFKIGITNVVYTGRLTKQQNSNSFFSRYTGNIYSETASSAGSYFDCDFTFKPVVKAIKWVSIIKYKNSNGNVIGEYSGDIDPYSIGDIEFSIQQSGGFRVSYKGDAYYSRMLTSIKQPNGVSISASDIPTDDIVENTSNYKYVIKYAPDIDSGAGVKQSQRTSVSPTKYGKREDGLYYNYPYSFLYPDSFMPVSRDNWGDISYWYTYGSTGYSASEVRWRNHFTMKDCSPLASVINVLIKKIDPTLSHDATEEYSQFLYGNNADPLSITPYINLFITAKSNVLVSTYDKPAQKANITLKSVMDMLRDCFRCFWYIEDGKFKIEHEIFFLRGGSYTQEYNVMADITALKNKRNGKTYDFATGNYSFDKQELPERYEFAWMDEVNDVFKGWPIEIKSNYVEKGNKESVSISSYTTDIDKMLITPSDFSKDGFALFNAMLKNGNYLVEVTSQTIGGQRYFLQNGYMAMHNLQDYYKFNLSAKKYEINGDQKTAIGIARSKKQTIRFPFNGEPDVKSLIKTSLGFGYIEKISVNLASEQLEAELGYEPE